MTTEDFEQEAATLRLPLMAVALHYLHNQEDAEDTVQDVLARLWRMVEELHPPMAPLAKVLTRNLCVDRIRRQPQATVVEIDAGGKGMALGETLCTETQPPEQDAMQRLQQAMEQLTPKQQLVMRLRHTEGMSTADMAKLTGDTEAALRQTLCRARQAMRKWYLQHLGE